MKKRRADERLYEEMNLESLALATLLKALSHAQNRLHTSG